MTFGELLKQALNEKRVPSDVRKGSIRVGSAEGSLGKPAGLEPGRAPKLDESEVVRITTESDGAAPAER